jgi:hypothetical protein
MLSLRQQQQLQQQQQEDRAAVTIRQLIEQPAMLTRTRNLKALHS